MAGLTTVQRPSKFVATKKKGTDWTSAEKRQLLAPASAVTSSGNIIYLIYFEENFQDHYIRIVLGVLYIWVLYISQDE